MADYSAIKTGIKTRLDTLSGLIATFDTVPDTIYPPVAVVVPRGPEVEYNVSMGNSAHNSMLQRFNFDVLILAGRFNSEYSQGSKITKKDLVEFGANIEALIQGGHIADTKTIKES